MKVVLGVKGELSISKVCCALSRLNTDSSQDGVEETWSEWEEDEGLNRRKESWQVEVEIDKNVCNKNIPDFNKNNRVRVRHFAFLKPQAYFYLQLFLL